MEVHLHDSSVAPPSERTPLLREHGDPKDQKIEVLPLKYGQVYKAADTIQRAFVDDTIMNYYGSVDTTPFFHARWMLRHNVTLWDAVHQGRVLTVNRGEAVLEYGVPGNSKPSKMFSLFFKLLESSDTPELRKRKSEFRGKIRELVEDALGAQVEDMYDLQVLATAPEVQGRGYASALVNAVTDMADAEGRDTWVIAAGASGYYEQLGFHILREGVLGDDNPTWDGAPIPIFVLRKHASSSAKSSLDTGMLQKS